MLADPQLWAPGNIAEIGDDGIVRSVVSVFSDRIVVAPAPGTLVNAGDVIFGFPGGSIVSESEVLGTGSVAIDSGDPEEVDIDDDTRTDLGPVGWDTPGNVGVETGISVASITPFSTSHSPKK